MQKLTKAVEKVIDESRYVTEHNRDVEWKNKAALTLLASAAFAVMSVVNIYQKSYSMLATTVLSSTILLCDYLAARRKHDLSMMQIILIIMVSVVFTHYVIIGGNDGFASLWLILVPFLAMMVADLRFGFFMSLYFFVFLVLTFSGPMHSIIRYDYNRTFLLRFPILYFIAFSFATYSAVRTCHYQYKLDKREEELQRLGTVDMLTGLMNRNSYNAFAGTFRGEDTDVLTVIFIDVNGLHELNNRKGHIAGDDMLKKVSAACSSYFDRKGIYRMGGDEFLIICEDQDEASAEMKMKNVSEEIGKEGYSVSYGIESRESDLVLAAMINAADRKMLKRKEEYYKVHGRRDQ